jgi:hypothetical protein
LIAADPGDDFPMPVDVPARRARLGLSWPAGSGFGLVEFDRVVLERHLRVRRRMCDDIVRAEPDVDLEIRCGHDFFARLLEPDRDLLPELLEAERLLEDDARLLLAPERLPLERADPRFEPRFVARDLLVLDEAAWPSPVCP